MTAVRLLAALTAVLVLAGCSSGAPQPRARAEEPSSLTACPGQAAGPATGEHVLPALSLECPGGGTLDLAKAPGTPTLVTLWGSWCPPCREELPLLQELSASSAGKVQVVGVISKDGRPQAESFAADAGVTFPSAFDGEGKLMAELGINVLPYTYFVAADGTLAYTQVGPVTSIEQLRGLVAEHLGVRL